MAIDPTLYRRSYEAAAGPALDPVSIRRQRAIEDTAAQEQQYRAAQLQGEQAKIAASDRRQSLLSEIGTLTASGDRTGARNKAFGAGAFDIVKQLDEMDNAGVARMKNIAESTAPIVATLGKIPRGPARDAAFQQAAPLLAQSGYTPEQIQQLGGKINDDNFIGLTIANGMKIADYQRQEQDIRDYGFQREKFGETVRSNRVNESVALGNLGLREQEFARGPSRDGMPNAPSGYRFTATGALEAIPGGPADGSKLTEGQSKSVGYYRQAAAAARTMNNVKDYNPSLVANALYGSDVGYTQLNQSDRRILNSQLAFANGVLRLETGATINDNEIRNKARQLFPLPGDGPDVIADKAAQRSEALASMRAAAGPGVRNVPLVVAKPKAAPVAGGKIATGKDGVREWTPR